MKQKALISFSGAAIKGGYSDIFMPLLGIASLYAVYFLISLSGAYIICRYYFFFEMILLWCAARLVLKILLVLLTVKKRAALIRRCIVKISLPCGYERKIHKKLRRLYMLRGMVRLMCRIVTAAVIFLGIWVIASDAFAADSVYRLMGAFQAVPLLIVIIRMRIRLMLRFWGAEVLTVSDTSHSIRANLRESGKMLSGQYGFIAALFLRSIRGLLLPFLLPKFIQTLVSYFSVRHIEWQYQENNNYEQAYIQGRYKGAYEAGDISAP